MPKRIIAIAVALAVVIVPFSRESKVIASTNTTTYVVGGLIVYGIGSLTAHQVHLSNAKKILDGIKTAISNDRDDSYAGIKRLVIHFSDTNNATRKKILKDYSDTIQVPYNKLINGVAKNVYAADKDAINGSKDEYARKATAHHGAVQKFVTEVDNATMPTMLLPSATPAPTATPKASGCALDSLTGAFACVTAINEALDAAYLPQYKRLRVLLYKARHFKIQKPLLPAEQIYPVAVWT